MQAVKYTSLISLFFFGLTTISHGCVNDSTTTPIDNTTPPHEVIQKTTNTLLDNINKHKDEYQADPSCFYQAVQTILGPTINFTMFSKRVMGKHAKKASTEQHERFEQTIRTTALKTYANALLENKSFEAKVLPNKKPLEHDAKKAKVDMEIITEAGAKYPLSYSMSRKKGESWKVANVVVNGINLGLTFRNQFSQAMQSNSNNIDKVISSWSTKVE